MILLVVARVWFVISIAVCAGFYLLFGSVWCLASAVYCAILWAWIEFLFYKFGVL